MKVLVPGREQKGWMKEFTCTGDGNRGDGCGARLLVGLDDLFTTASGGMGGDEDVYLTFECAGCEVWTDLSAAEARNAPQEAWRARRRAPGRAALCRGYGD